MIDIHSHILPGIDDGAQDEEASVELARAALAEGITRIVATPHYNQTYVNAKADILPRVTRLNERLASEGLPLDVLPGQEPRIFGEFVADYEQGNIVSLNNDGHYVLIELPSSRVPRYTGRLLYDIQMNGLIPIIVHPERNQGLLAEPDTLYQFVLDGALTQITAGSVTGHFGKAIKKFTDQLIEHHLAHVLASDVHGTHYRTFRMQEAQHEIEKNFDVGTRYMLQENAELMIEGKNVMKEIPAEPGKRKKFMGLF